MDELWCFHCNKRIGWITKSGPHGLVFCDECKEEDDRREEEVTALKAQEQSHDR